MATTCCARRYEVYTDRGTATNCTVSPAMIEQVDHTCAIEYLEEFNAFTALPWSPCVARPNPFGLGCALSTEPSFMRDFPSLIDDQRRLLDFWGWFMIEGDLDLQKCWARGSTHYPVPRSICASTVARVAEFIRRVARNGPVWQVPHIYEFLSPHAMMNLFFDLEEWPDQADAASAEFCTDFLENRVAATERFVTFLKEYMGRTLGGADDGTLQVFVYMARMPSAPREDLVPHLIEFRCRVIAKHPKFMFRDISSLKMYATEVAHAFSDADPGGLNLLRAVQQPCYEPWGYGQGPSHLSLQSCSGAAC